MGFTLRHEILHINISGLLPLQRLILEIFPGEKRAACSQLFLTSLADCISGGFCPQAGVGWARTRAQPGYSSWVLPGGFLCTASQSGARLKPVETGLLGSWGVAVAALMFECHGTSRTWNTLMEFQVLKRALESTFAWKFHHGFIHELNNIVCIVQSTQSRFQEFMVRGCFLSRFIRGEKWSMWWGNQK